jgi:beta-galactosidase
MVFNKPQIWQTYQEETFKLKKRIRGIKSIYFESKQSIHIKGFIFKKYDKTFEKIYALENNQIYGDTFTVTPDEITGIGNNVSLIFKGFHFGIKGMTKLIICGHSPIDKNTIHVRFTTKDGDIDQLCEFTKSDGFTERIFTLDEVNGDADVTFVFLPGCNFDFRYFRFAQD